jgi:hypothetical protein
MKCEPREYVYIDVKNVRRALLNPDPNTANGAFMLWLRKIKHKYYDDIVRRAIEMSVVNERHNDGVVYESSDILRRVFEDTYVNVEARVIDSNNNKIIDETYDKDVDDPVISINLYWFNLYLHGLSIGGCSTYNYGYEAINGAISQSLLNGNTQGDSVDAIVDITNSSYFLNSAISSSLDYALNNVSSSGQACGYNNSNGYGVYGTSSGSGHATFASNTLMWGNSWTTPSSTPAGLTLDIVDFAVGPHNVGGASPRSVCGACSWCGTSWCCGFSGLFNPGICQGYPWLPALYAKFSGVTVGPSQTVTYYLYLV